MTRQEWFEHAEANKDAICDLLSHWHPVCLGRPHNMKITAPNAERAASHVRDDIRKNFEGNPVSLFEEALRNKDLAAASKLLSDVWFGVPESTSCWGLTGFREVVALIEDTAELED
jgi:hypothetical protein